MNMTKKTVSKRLRAAALCLATLLFPAWAPCSSAQNASTALRVLCLGNSITHHDYAASIEWYGNWGMAASKEENDYCHQLQSMLSQYHAGTVVTPLNIAYWERNLNCDIDSLVGSYAKSKDIIVIRLGENVQDKTAFKDGILRLVRYCKEKAPRVVITGCYWEDADKEAAIKAAAKAEGIAYIPLSYIDKEEGSRPKIGDTLYSINGDAYKVTKDFILSHPGDKGMLKIAQAIYSVLGGSDAPTLKINIHKAGGNTDTYAANNVSKAVFSGAGQSVVVELKAGGNMILSLGSSPQLTFDDDSVNVSAGETAARLHAADIARVTFQDIPSAVERIGNQGEQRIKSAEGTITAENFAAGTAVKVFDTAGAVLLSAQADGAGRASLNVSHLPAGAYIVQAGAMSFKFIKR